MKFINRLLWICSNERMLKLTDCPVPFLMSRMTSVSLVARAVVIGCWTLARRTLVTPSIDLVHAWEKLKRRSTYLFKAGISLHYFHLLTSRFKLVLLRVQYHDIIINELMISLMKMGEHSWVISAQGQHPTTTTRGVRHIKTCHSAMKNVTG